MHLQVINGLPKGRTVIWSRWRWTRSWVSMACSFGYVSPLLTVISFALSNIIILLFFFSLLVSKSLSLHSNVHPVSEGSVLKNFTLKRFCTKCLYPVITATPYHPSSASWSSSLTTWRLEKGQHFLCFFFHSHSLCTSHFSLSFMHFHLC